MFIAAELYRAFAGSTTRIALFKSNRYRFPGFRIDYQLRGSANRQRFAV